MSCLRRLQSMIGCLLVVLFSLPPHTTQEAARESEHRWNPTNADNPHWKMAIVNRSADATGSLPYADFSLTLLPGKFLPRATCHAHVLNLAAIAGTNSTSDDKSRPKVYLLTSTDWIDCTLPDIQTSANITNITTPIAAQSNHTSVSFRWTQLASGGAVLRVQSNMSFVSGGLFERALDSLVGIWPPRPQESIKMGVNVEDGIEVLKNMARAITARGGGRRGEGSSAFDNPGALFIWQQGTFNIPANDLGAGDNSYMGQTKLSTLVDWVGICDGAGQCHANI